MRLGRIGEEFKLPISFFKTIHGTVKIMKTQFIIYSDPVEGDSPGVIVRDENDPGVFRGHYDVWFGENWGGIPAIKSVLASLCRPMTTIPLGD